MKIYKIKRINCIICLGDKIYPEGYKKPLKIWASIKRIVKKMLDSSQRQGVKTKLLSYFKLIPTKKHQIHFFIDHQKDKKKKYETIV